MKLKKKQWLWLQSGRLRNGWRDDWWCYPHSIIRLSDWCFVGLTRETSIVGSNEWPLVKEIWWKKNCGNRNRIWKDLNLLFKKVSLCALLSTPSFCLRLVSVVTSEDAGFSLHFQLYFKHEFLWKCALKSNNKLLTLFAKLFS